NRSLDEAGLNFATQRILDRIIFLRICEDRTVEQQIVLRRFARTTGAYDALLTEFRRLDSVYNGALFAPHFSERLELSDEVLQTFIEQLYFPYSPYRFDVFGPDLLGGVYERFLGREIDLDERRRVKLVEKPEVRHAGGVYYTPPWIVEEIVARTIGPLLAGRTPRTAEQLRIVDPACGSGSFLLGVLDYLIRWYADYYTAHPTVDRDRHYPTGDGSRKLTSDAKAAIVQRNIFGADIDPAAVEVAQMSLYLKILEAETSTTLHERPRLFPGPYLPSLSANVRAGNSLLAPDDMPQQLLFDEELRRRINPFDWRDPDHGFGAVFADRGGFDAVVGNPPYTRSQVLRRHRREESDCYEEKYATAGGSWDIATVFIERGLELLRPARGNDKGGRLGYIVTRTFAETDAAEPLREMLGVERHLDEVVDFGAGLVFDRVSAYTVLLSATKKPNRTWTLIRVPAPPTQESLRAAEEEGSPLSATLRSADLGPSPWTFSLPAEQALLDRLAGEHRDLGEVTAEQVFQGLITGAEDVYRCVSDGLHLTDPGQRLVRPRLQPEADPIPVEAEVLRRVVAGSTDLKRFGFTPSPEWILFPYERDGQDDTYHLITATKMRTAHPNAYRWLEANREALEARSPQSATQPWNDENWFAYSRRQNLERFAKPKVLVPYMVEHLNATADPTGDAGYFVNVSTGGYGVQLPDTASISLEFLAAVLSSELLSWVLRRLAREFRGQWMGARAGSLKRLPVVEPDDDAQAAVVALFDSCRHFAAELDATTADHDRELLDRLLGDAVSSFDRAIFDLYEITEEELRVIRSG
ncbi:MAG TPA: N-6 DNA methylase, partial [Solirubrobacterales bacterium]|nr:N-6 DNA methylase [Solirubrobacterales bacterium]